MRYSDLNLFVFFANCINEGVTDELAYFCSEIQKFSGCYVICEDGYASTMSMRIKAKVKRCTLPNTKIEDGNDAEMLNVRHIRNL